MGTIIKQVKNRYDENLGVPQMRPGFSFQSFLPGTISLRVTAQCPAKKDFHYNPSRMFFLHQKIIFYSEIVCASDCSENPFACS